ncbi:MAG: hypothetical protein CL878_04650 [Dehalococcoidia bacterium]|nr:hypothetical protein [Dehalococcoidia bacterium]
MSSFRQRLLDEMADVPTVDCHSHTMLRSEYEARAAEDRNLFTITTYFRRDMSGIIGTGHERLYDDAQSDEERWQRFKHTLDRGRNVSYYRHNIATYQGIFDFADDDLTDDNWSALNERIKEWTARPDWYDDVTRTKCNLVTQIRNVPWYEDWEPEYFTATLRMEPAIRDGSLLAAAQRAPFEAHMNREFRTTASLKQGLADYIDGYAQRGAIGIKLAHAYNRTLETEDVPEHEVEAIWQRALRGEEMSAADVRAFQDHIIWWLAGLCTDESLIFQIHTGMQGNWDHIPDSNPLHLLPMIRAHRNTRFDLFHAGYPYSRELGVLGKHYPNVWLNMCWMYLISMAGSRQILSEWIDLVPHYRLLGFGSDLTWPETIYGHLSMARSCIADVLAEKVEHDFLSKSVAIDLARGLMHDSPMAFYGLDGPAAQTQAAAG